MEIFRDGELIGSTNGISYLDFLGFIIRTRKSARGKLLKIYENPPVSIRVVRLTTQLEIDAFLEDASKQFKLPVRSV